MEAVHRQDFGTLATGGEASAKGLRQRRLAGRRRAGETDEEAARVPRAPLDGIDDGGGCDHAAIASAGSFAPVMKATASDMV